MTGREEHGRPMPGHREGHVGSGRSRSKARPAVQGQED